MKKTKSYKLKRPKHLFFFFIATDSAVRSMGFAMAFSPNVRSYGIPIAAITFVFCNICPCPVLARKRTEHMGELVANALGVVIFLPYVVPAMFFVFKGLGLERVLVLRFLENILFGILAAALGRTACGTSLDHELPGLVDQPPSVCSSCECDACSSNSFCHLPGS